MKKRNLFLALASGMVMFSACSNDEGLMDDANVNAASDAQQIVLQVANTGGDMKMRAGRPMLGEQPGQQIDNVQVIICNKDNSQILYTETVNNWNTDGVSEKYANGREAVIEIPTAKKLTPGTYKVYAFGYSNNSNYEKAATATAAEGTFTENTILQLKANTEVEEIFAGEMDLTVEQNKNKNKAKGFKKPVVLNRQVAGAYTYVKDIPYLKGAAKLRLVASTCNTQLVLGAFNSFDLTGNGVNNDANVKYVVNGTKADASNKVLYEINLTDWFNEVKDTDGDFIIDGGDNWKWNTNNPTGPKYVNGSVFGGRFVIPFQKADANSLELQLTNNDGSKVLRTWVIKLTKTTQTLTAWSDNAFGLVSNYQEDAYKYSVVRNHLYGVGKRTFDGTTTDPNPNPNPDIEQPGTNEPESLNNKQELILRVNDNWEVIHDMEIE